MRPNVAIGLQFNPSLDAAPAVQAWSGELFAVNTSRSRRQGLTNRSVRSLENLQANASTARTLNLIAVWQKHGETEEYRQHPFFTNPVLNRSIIVKHRLRQNERDAFNDGRTDATKVILPIDISDLRLGARSFFVGQTGYETVLEELFGPPDGSVRPDEALLDVLDSLPSLDPFLMRERLKKSGFQPARFYFDITDADTARMFQFVRKEVTPLIGLSFDDFDARLNDKTANFASKILANAGAAELEPLRRGMGMDQTAFEEGIFCWKGFIYYKWTLIDLLPKVRPVSSEIAAIRPTGPMSDDDRTFILAARARLSKAIAIACETVRLTLKVYDDAYADLTHNGQPQAFREFLLKAPSLFYELGERLGGVQHIISFWRYRFPAGAHARIAADELVELLIDFEGSLSFGKLDKAA
jgi:hypothetical protein